MAFTKAQKKRYLADNNRCPFCRSTEIVTTEQCQTDSDSAWQAVQCNTCDKTWRDVYKLVDVEEND